MNINRKKAIISSEYNECSWHSSTQFRIGILNLEYLSVNFRETWYSEFKCICVMCIFSPTFIHSLIWDQEKKEGLFRRTFIPKRVLYPMATRSQQLTLPDDFFDSRIYTWSLGSQEYKKFIFPEIKHFISALWASVSSSVNCGCWTG